MRRRMATLGAIMLVLQLVLGGIVGPSADTASAQTPPKKETANPAEKKQRTQDARKKVTQGEREEAAARSAKAGLRVPSLAAPTPNDMAPAARKFAAAAAVIAGPGDAPQYFSVPNYANSPLPTVTGGPGTVAAGNPLVARGEATDMAGTAGSLAPILVVNQTPLPAGVLNAIQTYNQPGSGPNSFHAYVLRPSGVVGQYQVVFDSGALTVASVSVGQMAAYPLGPVDVQAGDLLAHYGKGIPFDIGTGTDGVYYPSSVAPVAGGPITLGDASYPAFPQARTYSISAIVATGAGPALGNGLIARGQPTDMAGFPGVLTPILVVNPVRLPAGALTSIQVYNQPGSGPNTFHAYVLRPTSVPNQYQVIHDSGALQVLSVSVGQVVTYPMGSVAIQAGDMLAHYGKGIPFDLGVGTDNVSYPCAGSPLAGSSITLGDGAFPSYPQLRTYSIAANVTTGSTSVTGGIRKFVDGLPGLGAAGANNLGQYIPVAIPDTTTFPGSDYYEIELGQYTEKMHSDLPATTLRGYRQTNTTDATVNKFHYLGPAISATKDRPVRIKFTNSLPTGTGGNLFLPVDTTVMGAGMTPGMNGMADPDPQNPMCGMPGAKDPNCFPENRATLHLHGGITPWISDGTPHQWITPAGETTNYPQGVSVTNVPDMDMCGGDRDGCQTFFYTNQQSARLLFYHDHAWGITRLNVYAGEAAPYIITDATEQALVASGTIPPAADTIPLVVQDKTFVPSDAQLATTDPLWDTARWGGLGGLWLPHVYVPAQNPGDASGVNQFGRWAYGPWFWPPTTGVENPPVNNPYFDPACDPDLTWCEPPIIPGTPYNSMGMEAFHDTPVVNGTAYPTTTIQPKTYRLRILNAASDRFLNLSLYKADPSVTTSDGRTNTEVALNPAEVAAALTDTTIFPTPVVGTEGPSWIQIGTEGGFLPAPVEIPAHPITWVTDPTVFNAGNVDQHSLLLGPAERADVIVDFSQFAGQTLILYNDAPAAFPARDPRYDYYTGNADLRDTGGVPTVQAGFGPNTRTVMQIKVAGTPAPAFDKARLDTAFAHKADGSGVFESSQKPVIVGQGAYNSAYGTAFQSNGPRAGLAQIYDGALDFDTVAGTPLHVDFKWKAIQDEMGEAFDKEYGRMSGNLGLEVPNTQAGVAQNLILLPYVNPATEVVEGVELPAGATAQQIAGSVAGVQIWKITHNGVDTHPIHWHLFDVQVMNRVGWDGIVRKPDANELGWKDTLRISPLEDTIVALRPIVPKVPWGLPDSKRPLNPMMPIGDGSMFNNTDPFAQPINPPITNQVVNFGWEYVWHCHILSHEEMDMMRPITVNVSRALAKPPVVSVARNGNSASLSWADGTPVNYSNMSGWGDPAGEVGYRIERAPILPSGKPGTYLPIGTALANATAFTDSNAPSGTPFSYRVVAFNAAGDSPSLPVGAGNETTPAAPTSLTATLNAGPQVALAWIDNSNDETYFTLQRQVDGGALEVIATPAANTTSFVDKAVSAGHTYQYRVAAVNSAGTSAFAASSVLALTSPPATPTNLAGTAVRGTGKNDDVTLTWTDNSANETGFTIERATNASFTRGLYQSTVAANAVTATQTGLSRNVTYYYRVRADNAGGQSAWSNVISVVTP